MLGQNVKNIIPELGVMLHALADLVDGNLFLGAEVIAAPSGVVNKANHADAYLMVGALSRGHKGSGQRPILRGRQKEWRK